MGSLITTNVLYYYQFSRSVMSNYLILCHPLLLLPSIFPDIRVFPNESVLHIVWPKYWSFSKDSKAGTNFKCLRNRNNLWGQCVMSTGKGRVWKVQRRKTWVLQKATECTRVHFMLQGNMWNLSALTRDQTHAPSMEVWSLNHWTTRGVHRKVPLTRILE